MSETHTLEEKKRREIEARTLAEATTPPPTDTKLDHPPLRTAFAMNVDDNATLPGEALPDQPVSREQFAHALSVSGLVTTAELKSIDDSLPPEQRSGDARSLIDLLIKKKRLTEYQAAQLRMGQTKGLVFGNYVVLDKLGEGGMGVVFKAQHRRMKRIVALKVLPAALTESPDAIARFHREVEAAAKLTHPNIAAAYDADEAGGVHFLVMEYVDGLNLSQTVKKNGPATLGNALNYLLQTARGLNHAHLRGVVHRDIKPGNLLLDSHATVKILDMGLARFDAIGGEDEPQQAELTQSGRVMGTVDYMAPEQALDAKHADQRADIYSLGCTLWYLLTGRPISPDGTLTQKLIWHQTEPPPSLMAVCPAVGPRLEAVYIKLLAKKPAERQQTMAEVIGDLETCLGELSPEDAAAAIAGLSGGAAGDPTMNQLRTGHATVVERPTATDMGVAPMTAGAMRGSAPPRSRWPLAVAALVLIGGGIGGTVLFMNANNNSPEKPEAVTDTLVHLTISHPGADLFLDEQKIAFNQFNSDADEQHRCVPLKIGTKHRITIAKAGFEEFSREIDAKTADHHTIDVALRPVVGPVAPPAGPPLEKFLKWIIVQRGSATLATGKEAQTVEVVRAADIPAIPYTIKAVKLDLAKLSDADFARLNDAAGLEALSLQGVSLTAAGADQIAKLTSLWSLDLSQAKLAAGALEKLVSLKELRDLQLQKTNVTDEALRPVGDLTKLENLYLSDTNISDAALKPLSGLGDLRQLALKGTKVTPAGVEGLKDALPRLKIAWDPPDIDGEIARKLLALGGGLTLTLDEGQAVFEVRKAADLPEARFHIKNANFANQAAIDDAVVSQLAALVQLQAVNLEGTSVTAAGLAKLMQIKGLKTIELGSLQVSDAAVDALKAAFPQAEIRWNPNNERQTAEWIVKQNGSVGVITPDGEQVNGIKTVDQLPAGRFQIREARLDGTNATDADLNRFKGLTRLETLGLSNTAVTDAGLNEIVTCTGLRDLYLSDTKVSDAGLAVVGKLPSLRRLLLSGVPITDRGLEQLKQRQLTHLSLAKSQITDDALLPLTGFTNLTWLALSGTSITDADLPQLTKLSSLQELFVDGTKLTDAGLEELGATLPKVKLQGNPADRQRLALRWILTSGGSAATDARDVRKLTELPRTACKLVRIDLGDLAKVTNEQLIALAPCTSVVELDLTGTQINDEGLKNLAGMTQLVKLSLGNTRVTDAGMGQLKSLTKLQALNLAGTRVTGAEFGQLTELTGLDTLVIDTARLTDRGVANLAPFAGLRVLNLNNNSALSDKCLVPLAGLEKLQTLFIRGTNVGDPGLANVAKLTNLAYLDLSNTLVTDAGTAQLKSLTNLKNIFLYGTSIGDGTLTTLAGLKNLRVVDAAKTKVTDGGISTLKTALPECRVTKSENRVDPNNPPLEDAGAGGGFRPSRSQP